MKKIRLLLIEDNRLVREGMAALLKEQPDLKIMSSSANGDALLRLRGLKPRVVLLDMGLQSHSSLQVVELVKREVPDARLIIMDLVPVQADIVEFVQAGVSGFILKDATLDDLLRTIRAVASGVDVLPPPMTGSLFAQIAEYATRKGSGNPFKAVRMTKREREIVALIAEGCSNKEIATSLNIAVDTVKSHVHNILEKLALHTRLEIASYAHRSPSSR
jgi:two-component system NarL family response regulator